MVRTSSSTSICVSLTRKGPGVLWTRRGPVRWALPLCSLRCDGSYRWHSPRPSSQVHCGSYSTSWERDLGRGALLPPHCLGGHVRRGRPPQGGAWTPEEGAPAALGLMDEPDGPGGWEADRPGAGLRPQGRVGVCPGFLNLVRVQGPAARSPGLRAGWGTVGQGGRTGKAAVFRENERGLGDGRRSGLRGGTALWGCGSALVFSFVARKVRNRSPRSLCEAGASLLVPQRKGSHLCGAGRH